MKNKCFGTNIDLLYLNRVSSLFFLCHPAFRIYLQRADGSVNLVVFQEISSLLVAMIKILQNFICRVKMYRKKKKKENFSLMLHKFLLDAYPKRFFFGAIQFGNGGFKLGNEWETRC